MDGIENYRRREQTYIKHQFLTQYLQVAALKILQSGTTTFNFVDGFAGPWHVSDEENYSDTSFHQALLTLNEVRSHLKEKAPPHIKNRLSELKMRFCFCEKEKKPAKDLKKFANRHEQFDIHVIHGLFEKHLDEIGYFCRDGFTFTFIDPTGWNIDSEPIMKFLKERRGEFIINFMEEHINRHVNFPKVAESFGRFLAAPEWGDKFNNLPQAWKNEKKVLHLLKEKIKQTGAATYVPDFPIFRPRENRIKMRLLLGTNSPKGIEVFRDVQKKVELQAIKTKNQLRTGRQHCGLFPADTIAALEANSTGVGCQKYICKAENRIIKLLKNNSPQLFEDIANDILESIPIRLTHTKDLIKKMKKKSIINYDLPPGKRKPQEGTLISLGSEATDKK